MLSSGVQQSGESPLCGNGLLDGRPGVDVSRRQVSGSMQYGGY